MDNIIVTHGTGQALGYVFNGIAMLLHGNGNGLLRPLFATAAAVGLTFALAKLFARQSAEPILKEWLFPVVIGYSVFFIPHTSIFIKDSVTKHQQKVDHIPMGLAKTAAFFSKVSFEMTKLMESAFSLPDDLTYQKNGSMYASQLLSQAGKQVITNAHLKENVDRFMGQCVIPEAMMGRKYDRHDLRTSKDLWALMRDNASKVRSVMMAKRHQMGKIVTCHAAAQLLEQDIKSEVQSAYTRLARHIWGHDKTSNVQTLTNYIKRTLPSALSHITKTNQANGDAFIQQMMVMDGLLTGADAAKRAVGAPATQGALRALLQQRTTFQTYGILAAQLLPVIKGVLEAIIYVLFIFLIPVSLVQMGISAITQWLRLVAWVNLWPPLCAVIHCLSTYMCAEASQNLLMGEEVSFSTNVALLNIQQDWMGMCHYISLFGVPTLAWALVSGSQWAITQMAGGLTGATQSLGASAAADAASGNFNAGNIHMATQTLGNVSHFQQTHSPQIHQGALSFNDGQVGTTLSADERTITQMNRSSLATSLNVADTAHVQVSEQLSDAQSMAQTETEALQSSQMATYQSVIDKGYAEQKDRSHMEGTNLSYQDSIQSSSTKMAQVSQQLAKDNNISDKAATIITAAVGLGMSSGQIIQKLGVNMDTQTNAEVGNAIRQAQSMNEQEQWQEHFQSAIHEANNVNDSQSSQQVQRHNESIQSSWQEAESHQTQLQYAKSRVESLQKTQSALRTHASTINHDASQELMEWMATQDYSASRGGMGMRGAKYLAAYQPETFQRYARSYAMEKAQGLVGVMDNVTPFKSSTPSSLKEKGPLNDESVHTMHQQHQQWVQGQTLGREFAAMPQTGGISGHVEQHMEATKGRVQNTQGNIQGSYDQFKDRSTVTRAMVNVADNAMDNVSNSWKEIKKGGEIASNAFTDIGKNIGASLSSVRGKTYDTLSNLENKPKNTDAPIIKKGEKHN